MSKCSVQSSWSEIPADLLKLIFKRLVFIDTVRFRAVCRSWNMAVRSCPSPGSLWFMFPSSSSLEEPNTTLCFLSLGEDRLHKVKKNVFADVCGGVHDMLYPHVSKQGWLKISRRGRNQTYLFNPISGHHIHLPPLDSRVFGIFLSSDPCCNKDYSVVVMHSSNPQSERMSFYKAGGDNTENTWTSTAPLVMEDYWDIICRNDKVFGLTTNKTLHVWDFSSAPTKVLINPTKFQTYPDRLIQRGGWYDTYLVESLGEIYIVQHWGSGCPSTTSFTVSKLDYSKNKSVQILTLPAGRAMLMKRNDSICVSIQDFPELEENSIYFQGKGYFGVYDLKEKKVREYKYAKWGIKRFRCPILIVRNPW